MMKKVAAVTLFFFCIIAFSAAPPASAHDGPTAEEASAGNMDRYEEFLAAPQEAPGATGHE